MISATTSASNSDTYLSLLQFLDLLEVFVGQIQDEESEHDAAQCREDVIPGEEREVDKIQDVPDAAPDQDEAEDDGNIFREIPDDGERGFLHRGDHSSERAAPEEVERVMRPLGILTSETERRLRAILSKQKRTWLGMEIGHWAAANIVVSGEGADKERRIQFLVNECCIY